MAKREIVCLANSRKGSGLCFAGVAIDDGSWIRPLGSGWEGAVLTEEQQIGTRVAGLLDVVSVPLGHPAPSSGQPENWQLASDPWEHVRTLSDDEARDLLDELVTEVPLFGNRGKAVHVDDIGDVGSSLALVKPEKLTWRVDQNGHLRVVFVHATRELDLRVTDPVAERAFSDDSHGDYTWRDDELCYLTVSITAEAHDDFHTKLVAGVIFLQSD